MPETDKRKHARIEALNVISYICTDEDDNQLGEGVGETMNISQGGILLKTPLPIESEYILLTTIDLEYIGDRIKLMSLYIELNVATISNDVGLRFRFGQTSNGSRVFKLLIKFFGEISFFKMHFAKSCAI